MVDGYLGGLRENENMTLGHETTARGKRGLKVCIFDTQLFRHPTRKAKHTMVRRMITRRHILHLFKTKALVLL